MGKTDRNNDDFSDLAILNRIDADPDISQAALAKDLQIAIGTVNGKLKRLIDQGSIDVKRTQRRKLRYRLTPEGHALQRSLTSAYIRQSFQLYRRVRQQAKDLLITLNDSEVRAVRLVGEGDIAEVCRLTCLEHQVALTDQPEAPVLVVDGLDVRLEWR
jgi:DNA-binding MarR family transcriptional regulator